MGQTLTHGIYLPDEGERNCYSGLAANWQILDSSVGTIAEHTTALAGKAPAVHTHTKSDITDFPAYGTTAGTICEGNDSRLSDARTPTSHTHGNITNDGKVGSAANKPLITTTDGAITTGSFGTTANTFCEGNDSRLSDARTPVAHTHGKADITDLFNSANTWTGDNTYTKYQNIIIAGTEIGVAPTNQNRNGLLFKDKNNETLGWVRSVYDSTGDLSIEMLITNKYSNGALDPNGTQTYQGIKQTLSASGDIYFGWSGKVNNHVVPKTNNSFDLGTSTNKWKSFNGTNPGALSLPDYSDTTYIDISGSIVPPSGQTTINYSGGENQYTPPVDGWLSIRCDGATFLQIYRNAYNCPGTTASRQAAGGKLVVTLPVLKNTTYTIKINTSGTTNVFQLYPCLGNV